jgi:hypothetical protein
VLTLTSELPLRTSRWQYAAGVAAAVCVGAAARLLYNVGFVGAFPQDDGIYLNAARMLAAGVDITARFHNLDANYLANPAENYAFRAGYIYPLSWCFRLFGEGDGPASIVGIASALVAIVVIAEIARTALGPGSGIAAAMVLAVLPDDIILTTRVLSDGPLRMFLAIACLMILRGFKYHSDPAFGYAGVALGLTYLTKIVGLPLFVLLGTVPAIESIRRRSPRPLVLYTFGFAAIFTAETIWYWWRTGEWLLHYRVVSSSIVHKLTFESHVFRRVELGRYVRVMWEGEFLWFAPAVLGMSTANLHGLSGFGAAGWIGLVGLLQKVRARAAEARILAGIAIGLYLFVELFPIDVRFADDRLQYELTYRNWRYILPITVAWIPLGGGALGWLWAKSRPALVIAGALLLMTSWPALARNYQLLRSSQFDMRSAAAFIEGRPERIYTDYLALSALQYYVGSRDGIAQMNDISSLAGSLPGKGDLVITGGRRGIELMSSAWEKDLPSWCLALSSSEAPPPGWRVLLRVNGRSESTRLHDLVILQYVGT